jgi:hypothetical protein
MNQTQTVTSAVAINTDPAILFETVKLSAINQTAWDSYRFEGVSSTGISGVSVDFTTTSLRQLVVTVPCGLR